MNLLMSFFVLVICQSKCNRYNFVVLHLVWQIFYCIYSGKQLKFLFGLIYYTLFSVTMVNNGSIFKYCFIYPTPKLERNRCQDNRGIMGLSPVMPRKYLDIRFSDYPIVWRKGNAFSLNFIRFVFF
jgi:hypothetical protein